jgi:hypothetical protein
MFSPRVFGGLIGSASGTQPGGRTIVRREFQKDELDERWRLMPLRKKGAMVPALTAVGKGVSATPAIDGHSCALIWCFFEVSVYFRCG